MLMDHVLTVYQLLFPKSRFISVKHRLLPTWYSISLGVGWSPLATGSGVTATVGEAGSVCCCEGGGAGGLAGSSSFWKSASDRSSIILISASLYARRSACEGNKHAFKIMTYHHFRVLSYYLYKYKAKQNFVLCYDSLQYVRFTSTEWTRWFTIYGWVFIRFSSGENAFMYRASSTSADMIR